MVGSYRGRPSLAAVVFPCKVVADLEAGEFSMEFDAGLSLGLPPSLVLAARVLDARRMLPRPSADQ